ncbi:unnamed protein product [Citrullus colocynthis]|uniref:Transmembrane protein n=1 Tax=Citrullus colocynthis TaxID=252529 RepID=A0ABP0Z6U7_9ROSI
MMGFCAFEKLSALSLFVLKIQSLLFSSLLIYVNYRGTVIITKLREDSQVNFKSLANKQSRGYVEREREIRVRGKQRSRNRKKTCIFLRKNTRSLTLHTSTTSRDAIGIKAVSTLFYSLCVAVSAASRLASVAWSVFVVAAIEDFECWIPIERRSIERRELGNWRDGCNSF